MTQRQARLSWLLAVVAVLAVGLFATAQVVAMHSLLTWSPKVGEPAAVSAVLAAPTPDAITAEVDAAALRALPPGARATVLATTIDALDPTALRVFAGDRRVWVVAAGTEVPGAALAIPPDATAVSIRYDGVGNVVTVASGGASGVGTPSPTIMGPGQVKPVPLTVSALATDKSMLGAVDVEVTTAPLGHQTPGWRWIAAVVALAAVAGLMVIALRRPAEQWPGDPAETIDRHSPMWTGSDTVVAFAAAAGLMLALPEFDDGWVLTTVRAFDHLDVFSNYYTVQAVAQPQGFWWTWIERLWLDGTGTPAFLLRTPAALILVWSWWFIRRRVVDQLVPQPRLRIARAGGACGVALAVPSLAMLLRPEPVMAALVAAGLALVVRYLRRPDPWVLGASALVAAAALGVHQTGWAVVGLSLALLPSLASWWRRTERPTSSVVPLLVGAASVLVLLLMLGTNLWLWWRSVQTFSTDAGYGAVFDEVARLNPLSAGQGFGSVPSRVMYFGVLIVGALAYLVRTRYLRGRVTTWTGAAAVLAVLGLALTSSKNPVHAGAVVPAAAVLLGLAVSDIVGSPRPWSRMVTAVAGLAVVSYLGAVVVGKMTPGSQELTDDPFQPWFAGGLLTVVVVIAGAVFAVTLNRGFSGWERSRGQAAAVATLGTTVVTVTLVVAATLLPAAAQAGQPASWVGQNLAALRGDGCGVAGEAIAGVPTGVAVLPQVADLTPPAGAIAAVPAASQPNPDPLAPQTGPPFPTTPALATPVGVAGWVSTGWYQLSSAESVAFWALSRTTTVRLEVIFTDGQGVEVARRQLPRAGEWEPVWLAFDVPVPPRASQVALLWTTDTGPVSVTPPARVTNRAPLTELAGGTPVWNNPQTHLQASCLLMPEIGAGVIEQYTWSVGPPTRNGAPYTGQMQTVQMSCPIEGEAAGYRCVYRLGPPVLVPVATTPAPEAVGWL